MQIDALPPQPLEVLKHALYAGNAVIRPFHVHRVGAKIDLDAKAIFHQLEVFIAGPEQGLKVWGDLQSDLQCFQCPPKLPWGVKLRAPRAPLPALSAEEEAKEKPTELDAVRD